MSKEDGIQEEPLLTFLTTIKGGKAEVSFNTEELFIKNHITKPTEFYFTVTTDRAKPVKSDKIKIIPPSFSCPVWLKDGKEKNNAVLDEEITISCNANDMPEGKEVDIEIWEKDPSNPYDYVFSLKSTVQNKKIEFNWTVLFRDCKEATSSQKEISEKGYATPEYRFVVRYLYFVSEPSPPLHIKCNYIEQALDNEGKPIPDTDYIFYTPDGKTIFGKTDNEGIIRQENLLIGKCKIVMAK